MRTVTAAMCVALTTSSQRVFGPPVVSSICDGLKERPVHVVGVRGMFCVPLPPCEGVVNIEMKEPLACPQEGQRDVLGEEELAMDSCCAVIDNDSGALGCILVEENEEQTSACLSSVNSPRERDFSLLRRRRTRIRMMQDVVADVVLRGSLSRAGSMHTQEVTETNPAISTTTTIVSATTTTTRVSTTSAPELTAPAAMTLPTTATSTPDPISTSTSDPISTSISGPMTTSTSGVIATTSAPMTTTASVATMTSNSTTAMFETEGIATTMDASIVTTTETSVVATAAPVDATKASVVTISLPEATTSPLAATPMQSASNPMATSTSDLMTTSTSGVMATTSAPMATTASVATMTLNSTAAAPVATTFVPANFTSVPVTSTLASSDTSATVAIPAAISVIPDSTTQATATTINMTAPATSSGSSLQLSERLEPTSSPPVGTTTPPVESSLILDSSSILPSPVSIPRTNVSSLPPLTTIPSSNLDFNTDGVWFTPTTTPTQPSSVTARPTSLNSRPTDQLATPTPGFPLIESVSESSSGSNGTAGLASAVDGSSIASKLVSTPTADSEAAGSPDSLPASSGSVLSATAGSPLESGSKSAGPTSLSGGLSADATGAISNGNGASLSSLTSSLPESSSRSESTEPSVLGLTAAGNSGETGSFDKLFSGTVGSPSVENVVSSPSQLRSSPLPLDSSILPSDPSLPSSSLLMLSSSSSLEAERLTPLPAESTLSKDVLQLFPITDVSSDDSLSSGEDTGRSNALGSNAMTFITVGTAAMVALMFGIFYLRPKRTNPHELLTPCEPPQPSNHTGAYPYNHSLELEAAGPYDAASTPRIDIIHTRLT